VGITGHEVGEAFTEDFARAVMGSAEELACSEAKENRFALTRQIVNGADITAVDVVGRLAAPRTTGGSRTGVKQKSDDVALKEDVIKGHIGRRGQKRERQHLQSLPKATRDMRWGYWLVVQTHQTCGRASFT